MLLLRAINLWLFTHGFGGYKAGHADGTWRAGRRLGPAASRREGRLQGRWKQKVRREGISEPGKRTVLETGPESRPDSFSRQNLPDLCIYPSRIMSVWLLLVLLVPASLPAMRDVMLMGLGMGWDGRWLILPRTLHISTQQLSTSLALPAPQHLAPSTFLFTFPFTPHNSTQIAITSTAGTPSCWSCLVSLSAPTHT